MADLNFSLLPWQQEVFLKDCLWYNKPSLKVVTWKQNFASVVFNKSLLHASTRLKRRRMAFSIIALIAVRNTMQNDMLNKKTNWRFNLKNTKKRTRKSWKLHLCCGKRTILIRLSNIKGLPTFVKTSVFRWMSMSKCLRSRTTCVLFVKSLKSLFIIKQKKLLDWLLTIATKQIKSGSYFAKVAIQHLVCLKTI